MLDKMTKDDLLAGMRVTLRDGQSVKIGGLGIGFSAKDGYKLIEDYTDDLLYGDEDTDTEDDLDIMRVALPSGAVIWERPQSEVRIFVFEKYKERIMNLINRSLKKDEYSRMWQFRGKLVSFKVKGDEWGLVDGVDVNRAWTRELTDEERKNWRKEHPRT